MRTNRVRSGVAAARREALAVWGLSALFVLLAAVRAWDHTYPFYDDVGFLELGNRAREMGGPPALLEALFAGTWAEDNRHPLYVAVLSLVAGRNPGYHRRAQALTIALGVLAVLSCWATARRHAGRRPALVLLAFLAVSETMIEQAAKESSEPLLIAFYALATGAVLDGFERPRAWIAAGIWGGLAYLTKASGMFLVVCFAIALLRARGTRSLREPWAWGMGLAFAATASPLLVRNVRVYGWPLHHWNDRLLWIDRLPDFAETFAPHALDRLPRGPLQLLRQSTLGRILWDRVVMGACETSVNLGDAMSLVAPAPASPLHIAYGVLGFLAAVVALRLLWCAPATFRRTFLLVQAGFFVAFSMFFSVVGGAARYLFPMTISLVAVLARELVARADAQASWRRGRPLAVVAVAAVAVALALALDPSPRSLPPGFAGTQAFLRDHLRPGESYAVDSRSHLEPSWLLPASNRMEIVSSAWQRQPIPPEELVSWFRERGVRYAVIDASSRSGAARRYFFFDRLPLGPDGSLPMASLPMGLRIAYVDPATPRRWLVLELAP